MAIDETELTLQDASKPTNPDEEQNDVRKAAVVVLKNRRKQLEAEHARMLVAIDSKIRELHEKRGQVIIQHKTAVDQIDQQLTALIRQVRNAETQAAKAARAQEGGEDAAIEQAIIDALARRTDISESLLRERLSAAGLDTGSLRKNLERLVREGRLVSKGGGNYALGRRR